MVKRSRARKNIEYKVITRGIVTASSDKSFQVKFPSKEGREKLQTFENKPNCYYQKPNLKAGVRCIYKNPKKQELIEIYSLTWTLLYKLEN